MTSEAYYSVRVRYDIEVCVEVRAEAGLDLTPGSPDWERLATLGVDLADADLRLPEGAEPWAEVEEIEEVTDL